MNVNMVGPVNGFGYGVAFVNLVKALARLGHEVALFPVGGYQPYEQDREALDACRDRAAFYDVEAPSVRVFHQDQLAEFPGFGQRIGFPFFEVDPLTAAAVHHMNMTHRCCVASEWAAGVARRSGVTVETPVVPLGVDRTVFHENVPHDRLDPDQTVFFHVGKWEVRKGHDFILDCFNRAFEPADRVVLKMMSHNPLIGRLNDDWAARFMASKMGAAGRIELVPRAPDQAGVARFMAAGDVGLFPARAEGWNLDLLEAMSCGGHVVATNYSAHTEFCDDANAYLVDVDGLEPAHDGVWFRGEGEWARLGPDAEEQMVEAMRGFHREKQTGGLCVNENGIETAKWFSWENSARRLLAALGVRDDA